MTVLIGKLKINNYICKIKNMTYTAFSYKVPLQDKEVETFGLIPNNTHCSMNFGFWNSKDKTLTLKVKM